MAWKIPLSDITLDEEELSAVREVLASRWLSMGAVTEEFERLFADYVGTRHAFAVSSGTAALHIAHRVLGISSGDRVITPSLTFVATSNSILYCGGSPLFADINGPDDLNISPEAVWENVTPETRAITVVHYAGYPCDMRILLTVAEENGLPLIEDAAHALGAEYRGAKCGSMGDIGCFSFFANKNLTTGEGGMIVTNDDALAEKVRLLRSHGMTSLTWDRHRGHGFSYDVTDLGFNYRLTEIASALGIVQLRRLDTMNRQRANLVSEYRRRLEGIPGISCPFQHYPEGSSHHIMPVIVSGELDRTTLMASLKEEGIQTSIHYPPIHLFTYYRQTLGAARGSLPWTEFAGDHELTLPLYPGMTVSDVGYITDCIREITEQ
ncbi:MAG: DegT/DnrJ/EryC1/StrS family aminotransferase [Methanomicrobiales archaeon]|nr:DegT/DnrJ/EryC1/StrS family aminotransferase [Methanomicrobiales archaeon]MDI6876491.1 DegT/DnrJ/EryC1/StrS family aminotransferase [Methanomicrobiales archaeon]